jgi:sugar phosphate isomerase/epimerase
MTRREALVTGAGVIGVAASSVYAFSTSASNGDVPRFGVRTPLPKTSLRDKALLLRQIGYDGIELGPELLNQPADAIHTELDGTGIAVSAIVGSLQLLNTEAALRAQAIELDRQRLRLAKELGAEFVIEVPVFGPNRFQDLSPVMTPREVEEKLLASGLKALAPDVKQTGVTLLIEPLTKKETHLINLQKQGAEIIRQVGAPGFKLLSDFYHMQLEEANIGETLTSFGALTGYVHLADGEARTEPGSLPFDYRPGFSALKKHGFSGWLTVESKATDNPEAALRRALPYLKQQWHEA